MLSCAIDGWCADGCREESSSDDERSPEEKRCTQPPRIGHDSTDEHADGDRAECGGTPSRSDAPEHVVGRQRLTLRRGGREPRPEPCVPHGEGKGRHDHVAGQSEGHLSSTDHHQASSKDDSRAKPGDDPIGEPTASRSTHSSHSEHWSIHPTRLAELVGDQQDQDGEPRSVRESECHGKRRDRAQQPVPGQEGGSLVATPTATATTRLANGSRRRRWSMPTRQAKKRTETKASHGCDTAKNEP